MGKIKKQYEAPFIEIVPMDSEEVMHGALSYVKYGNEIGGIGTVGDEDDPFDDLNLAKDWWYEDYDEGFVFEE